MEGEMTLVIVTAIIIYLVLIAWSWQSLGSIGKTKKIIFILVGIILMYLITLVVFRTTKGDIDYQDIKIQNSIQSVIVAICTGINGMIIMPQIGKILDQINENQIGKEQLIKRCFILVVVFVICLIFESGYMKDTQQGILKVYHSIE